MIRRAQVAGFTLGEIRELLALDCCDDRGKVREMARQRLKGIEEKMASVHASHAALKNLLRVCEGAEQGPCPIIAAFVS